QIRHVGGIYGTFVEVLETPFMCSRTSLELNRFNSFFSIVNVTLDPETAHPRLILSEDQKSVRWEYSLQESPDGPERFDADPCVLGCETFTSGRHCWVVDLTEGQYCAVGVSRESIPRKGAISFNPDEGIWAVQQWGFKNRALTSPPTPLNLPRVPKKILVLDYGGGRVAFYLTAQKNPIFAFQNASFCLPTPFWGRAGGGRNPSCASFWVSPSLSTCGGSEKETEILPKTTGFME
uniref:B30.2/SPRY domain-containing protein n=1 Tax=Phasianus colchicus TaxID=9054 RepID=A0A669R2K7_PHACC